MKNSRMSIASSFWIVRISRSIVSGVSAGKPRMYPACVVTFCARHAWSMVRYSVIRF